MYVTTCPKSACLALICLLCNFSFCYKLGKVLKVLQAEEVLCVYDVNVVCPHVSASLPFTVIHFALLLYLLVAFTFVDVNILQYIQYFI